MEIVRAVVVDRHIDDVFDFLADRTHDPLWWRDVVAVHQLAGDEPGPGVLYGLTLRRGRRVTAMCVEHQPPVRLAWREEDEAGDVAHIAYDLTSVWTAARVTRTEEPGRGGRFTRRRHTRAAGRALTALVRALERR